MLDDFIKIKGLVQAGIGTFDGRQFSKDEVFKFIEEIKENGFEIIRSEKNDKIVIIAELNNKFYLINSSNDKNENNEPMTKVIIREILEQSLQGFVDNVDDLFA